MIWKIATAAFALLAVSGWGVAWWWSERAMEDYRRADATQLLNEYLGARLWREDDSRERQKSIEIDLRKTVARLRWRVSMLKEIPYDDDTDPDEFYHESARCWDHEVAVKWRINEWRKDRKSGHWGEYLDREGSIRRAAKADAEYPGLSVRAAYCLLRGGVRSVPQLCQLTREEVMRIRNRGKISIKEIEEWLAVRGLSLKKEEARAS